MGIIIDSIIIRKTIEHHKIDEITFDVFINTNQHIDLITDYEKAWYREKINGFTAEEFDNTIDRWYTTNQDLKKELWKKYISHFEMKFSITDFIRFYDQQSDRKCHYCKISESQILRYRIDGLIKAKTIRGKYMEIDRINSNEEYCLNNIVLACYWCNNAKTDEFSLNEFKYIGIVIRLIWAIRRISNYLIRQRK